VIAEALDRQHDLYERWREQQQLAQQASARIAEAARAHQQRRAEALAAGARDPGPFDPEKLQREADQAAEKAQALGQAFGISHLQALRVASDLEPEWQALADERLGAARERLNAALDEVAAAGEEFNGAYREATLARNPAARERRKLPFVALPDLDAWRELARAVPGPGAVEAEPEPVETIA
jgi:hypothetical protein